MSRFATLRMSRPEWLDFRRSHVGGSDVAAIMGVSPWRTAYQVWAEKTGAVAPEDISDRPRVEWGTRLERAVAMKFADSHPDLEVALPGDDVEVLVPEDRPWAMATLDGRVSDGTDEAVLEIKTAHFPTARDWDDGVPPHYLAQVTHYLSVTGWPRAYVAVLIDGWDYREHVVGADPGDMAAVTDAVDAFWHDHVEAGVPPEATAADSGALLAAHGEPSPDYLDGDALAFELVEEWREATARERAAKSEANALAARLKAAIGGHSGLAFPEGRLTWTRSVSRRFDAKALQRDEPDVYGRYLRETATQRMTWRED